MGTHERSRAKGQELSGLAAGRSALVCALLAVTVAAVMGPRILSSQFGLLDDGITIQVSRLVNEAAGTGDVGLVFRLEMERGRFRPFYWLYNAMQYAVFGTNASGHFFANALALFLTALSVAGTVALVTRDALASLASGLAYVFSPPVIESYYTLSKPEVPLTLCLGASLWCWAGARAHRVRTPRWSRRLLAASAVLLLLGYLTKETAQTTLLVAALWVAMSWTMGHPDSPGPARVDHWYLVANGVCAALFWIGRQATGTASIAAGGDSRHYVVTVHTLLSAPLGHLAWNLRDFPALLPLYAFLVWVRDRQWNVWIVYVPALWVLAWTAIMLPWHSIYEYYLLPGSAGIALIMGAALACVVRSVRAPRKRVRMVARAILALILISTPFVLGNMVTSGRVQLAVDVANAHLVDFLASTVPASGIVLVNVPAPNEYVDELSAHLRALKGRPDVRVAHADRPIGSGGSMLLVSPVVRNQPFPSVRLAVSEASARPGAAELQARHREHTRRVYRYTERFPLFLTQLERPLCPLLARARVRRDVFCRTRRLVDTRHFEYGWEVYILRAI